MSQMKYTINRRKFLNLFGCGCCSLVLPSCATVPITERRQLSIIPEATINRQAATAYEQFKSKTKLITIKNFCFYIFIFPILLFKPEIFEMLFRIGADFSGFPSYSSLTGHKAVKFPYSKYLY